MFIRYLAQRRPSLLDPQDRSRVICEGDPLGRVFGVRHFTKDETKSLLLQHLSPVDEERPAPVAAAAAADADVDANVSKRGAADEPSGDGPDRRRSCPDEWTAEPAAPGPSGPAAAVSGSSGLTAGAPRPSGHPGLPGTGGGAAPAEEPVESGDDTDDHRRTYAHEMEPVDLLGRR
ncbi:translation initiation factor IF-2-like [Pollicipes pollicipes]|uniref:translation initiation factor IF-2-like n=1 Tax=Pollicipes pollicipes TaxID=41117 RepID=UPI0018859345|nr:translation initiation factor IF-2-like [Pollicipes pollicipes]